MRTKLDSQKIRVPALSGYTLIEMVMVIVIMSVIGLTAGFVIVESIKVCARTAPGLEATYQARMAAAMESTRAGSIGSSSPCWASSGRGPSCRCESSVSRSSQRAATDPPNQNGAKRIGSFAKPRKNSEERR